MAQDDQSIIDSLASASNELIRYSIDLTDALERRIDYLALQIRESLSSATWLPPSARPAPPPQYIPASSRLPPLAPKGLVLWTKDWMSEHRAVTAAAVGFFGTGAFIYWKRQREYVRKRRAKRTANGQRSEVVVVAGAVNTSFPASLVQDLERRGFIVYVVVSDAAEEEAVRALSKPDILPLHLDVTNHDLQSNVSHFPTILQSGTTSTAQHLAGLILVPSNLTTPYPPSPLETTDPTHLADALNTCVLYPTLTLQALLPALTAHKARILLLTPATSPAALRLPFHGIDAATAAAMDALAATLAAETRPLGLSVVRFRLGSFEYGSAGADARQVQVLRPTAATIRGWPSAARAAYSEAYRACVGEPGSSQEGGSVPRVRRSPMRELNNAVFDALTQARDPTGVWRVGRGSWAYELVGRFAPQRCVGWTLGLRASWGF